MNIPINKNTCVLYSKINLNNVLKSGLPIIDDVLNIDKIKIMIVIARCDGRRCMPTLLLYCVRFLQRRGGGGLSMGLGEACNAALPSGILTDRCIAYMNAIGSDFPGAHALLCLWHANKAVMQRCQPVFIAASRASTEPASTEPASSHVPKGHKWTEFFQFWHSIINSRDEHSFKERVLAFEKKPVPDHIAQVSHTQAQWLDLYKERLVKAWVDQHAHFGNVANSRVEEIQALLKIHLRKSTLDLFEDWRAIKHALLLELAANQAKQQIQIPVELSGSLYATVRGWVSHEALRKTEELRKQLEKKIITTFARMYRGFHKVVGSSMPPYLKIDIGP